MMKASSSYQVSREEARRGLYLERVAPRRRVWRAHVVLAGVVRVLVIVLVLVLVLVLVSVVLAQEGIAGLAHWILHFLGPPLGMKARFESVRRGATALRDFNTEGLCGLIGGADGANDKEKICRPCAHA
jgi:hypothetical protein